MNKTALESLSYVIELLDTGIEQQQKDVDEWLARVEFYEGEGWDDITEQASRILRRSVDELQRLRQHREQLQQVKNMMVNENAVRR